MSDVAVWDDKIPTVYCIRAGFAALDARTKLPNPYAYWLHRGHYWQPKGTRERYCPGIRNDAYVPPAVNPAATDDIQ